MAIGSGEAKALGKLAKKAHTLVEKMAKVDPKYMAFTRDTHEPLGIFAILTGKVSHAPGATVTASVNIPHADLQELEKISKLKPKQLTEYLSQNKTAQQKIHSTVDSVADLAALSEHEKVHKSAYRLQGKILAHRYEFHAPDYSKLAGKSAQSDVYHLRQQTLDAIKDMKGKELRAVSQSFGKAGLTKDARLHILDPDAVALHTYPPQLVKEGKSQAESYISRLGKAVQKDAPVVPRTAGEPLPELRHGGKIFRDESITIDAPAGWIEKLQEKRAAATTQAGVVPPTG
jgi:flagellar biosynthesis chaperone FliJ